MKDETNEMSDIKNETWKPVRGFEGFYEVSTRGNVRSLARRVPSKNGSSRTIPARILKPKLHAGRYLGISLRANGKRDWSTVHKLVAIAFLGARPSPIHEVNHKNAIKTDNCVQNLEWVTHQENMAHSVAIGAALRGSGLPQSKLTEADIVIIRQRIARGEMNTEIGKTYGVNKNTIRAIGTGKTWKHVDVSP